MAKPQYRAADQQPDDLNGGTMGFLEHLDELRTRIIRCCLAIIAGMAVAFVFLNPLGAFVLGPALDALPPGSRLIGTRPGEGFSFYFDLALISGVVVAAPVVTYQLWRFIAPALHAREKRLAGPFIALATVGTLLGAAFSHYVLFPSMMAFFSSFDSELIHFTPRVEDTFGLYKNTLIAMVAVFQLPTLVLFLARLHIVTAALLWRKIRYAILAIVIIAAVLTPSADPWNQMIFAVPMVALYFVSIGVAWLAQPGRRRIASDRGGPPQLELVIAAAVVDQLQARRRRPYRQA
jgi:sec-independent protein translocase protein TatC